MALQEYLQESYTVRVCREGYETLQTMQSFKPDVVILDLLLPGLDGVTLLQKATDLDMHPTVLATTRFASDYMLDAMERLGVGYVMVKPCGMDAIAARLADLTREPEVREVTQPDLPTLISNVLRELRFQTHPRGYACLREALMMEIKNPGQQVTKTLYPAVGKICGGNGEQVERAIRLVIKQAWLYRDNAGWSALFPTGADGQVKCPSNKAFISTIASHILEKSKENGAILRKIG